MSVNANEIQSSHRVLLIDANDDERNSTSGYMNTDRFSVTAVANAKDAISQLGKLRFDLIIIDPVDDPKANLVLVQKLKAHKTLGTIPVIVFTNSKDVSIQNNFKAEGIDDYLSKPFAADKFREVCISRISAKANANAKTAQKTAKANELVAVLKEQLEKEEIELPSQPKVLYKVISMLNDDASSLLDIGALLEKEPSMSTKILKAANSVAFAGAKPALNVAEAIMRIGLKRTLEFVLVISNAQLFQTETEPFKKVREDYWHHSLQTAVIAKYFGEQLGYSRTDNLFAFGLLHDIGKLALLRILLSLPSSKTMKDADVINKTLDKMHAALGATLLKQWLFPKEFIDIALFHHEKPIANKHGKHLVITSLANLAAHEFEGGITESSIIRLIRQPHTQILKLKPTSLKEMKDVVDKEMELMKDFY